MASLHLQNQKPIRLRSPLKIWAFPVVQSPRSVWEPHRGYSHLYMSQHFIMSCDVFSRVIECWQVYRSSHCPRVWRGHCSSFLSLCFHVQKFPFFSAGTVRYRVPGLDFSSCLQSLLFTHLWNVSSLHWNSDDMSRLYLPPARSWFIKSPAGAVKLLWRDMAAHL